MVLSPPAESRICPHCGSSCSLTHLYCPACGFPIGTLGAHNEDKFVGKTLPGGYHILDLISVGGMGRVYRAEQSALGRTVAVKIIHPHLLSDDNSAVRFMTEARAASQLNHPNSVAVFDFGRTDDGQPYLVMEFLRGKDLARVAYEEGPLSFTRMVDVLRQVLAALAEAHDLGIVHRDLKPENVILEPLRRGGDFVKVVDFGLAKLKADASAPNVTSPGIVCGTPDYMAPEQGRGDPIDGRSDLYAVGVILFQLLTGQLPFEAESPTQVVMMHMTLPVPDPRQIAPERNIPQPLIDVVFRALEKDANHRYQDALEFADALREALLLSESVPPESRVSAAPSLAARAAAVTCPACGNSVPPSKFCGECGSRLPAHASPAAVHAKIPTLPLELSERDDDLDWLRDRLDAVGDSVIGARIVGELGMGKTRLLEEFATSVEELGNRVVRTLPDPYYAEVAYYSLREAIRDLAGLDPDDIAAKRFPGAQPEAVRGLTEVFAGGPARDDVRKPVERRYSVAAALCWAMRQAALDSENGRIVVLIDDMSRVNTSSRRAFADVLGEHDCPALLVAAHMPGLDLGWSSEHAAARVLSGLSPATARHLLKDSAPRDVDALDEGRGILPMYVEQLVRYSLEGGTDAPRRLGDLIALRYDTIEPNARRLLQALVVLGDRVDTRLVAQFVPKMGDVSSTLDTLVHAGMVERHGDRISTAHPLLREVILGGIPVLVRKELHAKALGLSDKTQAPLEARASYAYYAEDAFQALVFLEQGAARAAARDDTDAEVLALRRGLELARQEISRGELDDPLHAMLIFAKKLGVALTRAGNFADAEGVLREALDLAGPSGTERAQVLAALAQVAHSRHRATDAISYIDAAIEAAQRSGSNELLTSLSDTRRAWAS